MILIAHRGNTNGENVSEENKPDYVYAALAKGFDVEIDVWKINDDWWLGHDMPQYKLHSASLLKERKAWCHAKNLLALCDLLKLGAHCFWHQNDDYTLTSRRYIWTYPEKSTMTGPMIIVMKTNDVITQQCSGICSDYVNEFR